MSWRGEFDDGGFEEFRGGVAGGSELGFQRVDQGHQFVHFRDDSALLG